LYVEDYNGRNCFARSGQGNTAYWAMRDLRPYIPNAGTWNNSPSQQRWTGQPRILYCPEDPRGPGNFYVAGSQGSSGAASYLMPGGWGFCQQPTGGPYLCLDVQLWSRLAAPAIDLLLLCKSPDTLLASTTYAANHLSQWHATPGFSPAVFADGHVEKIQYFGYQKTYYFPPNAGPIPRGCPPAVDCP
jgi:prepilin-type processing-associated H-X9-DG protein